MKYDNYRQNLKAVRKLLYAENTPDMIGQFGKYTITTGRQSRTMFTAIWNAKTDNIVAMKNAKGNVLVREASVYSGQLLNSKKRKVVKGSKLADYRRHIPSHFRQNIKTNMIIESALERLIDNNDQPNRVLLCKTDDGEINFSSFISGLRARVDNTMENTRRTLENSNNNVLVEASVDGTRKIYLQIKDYEAEIALERKVMAVKVDIIKYLKENYNEFESESLLSNSGRNNPFIVELEIDGTPYFGSLDGYFMSYLGSDAYSIEDIAVQFVLQPDSESMRAERQQAWSRRTGRSLQQYMYEHMTSGPRVTYRHTEPVTSSVWGENVAEFAPTPGAIYNVSANDLRVSTAVQNEVENLTQRQIDNITNNFPF